MKHVDLAGAILNVVESSVDPEEAGIGFQIKIKAAKFEEGTDYGCDMCEGPSVAVYDFDPTEDLGVGGVVTSYCQQHAINSINYELESNGGVLEIAGQTRTEAL